MMYAVQEMQLSMYLLRKYELVSCLTSMKCSPGDVYSFDKGTTLLQCKRGRLSAYSSVKCE